MLSIRNAPYNGEVTTSDMQILWCRAGSLVPIFKLYEDFTPPLNEIYHQRSGMASYSKELISPPSYKREVYMVAAGIPLPDQLWKGPGGGGTSFSEKCKIPLAYQFI